MSNRIFEQICGIISGNSSKEQFIPNDYIGEAHLNRKIYAQCLLILHFHSIASMILKY